MTKATLRIYIIGAIASIIILLGWWKMYSTDATLQSFVALTATDPLFYSPFYDVETYRAEIADLERAEAELLDISKKNISDTGIRADVYLRVYEDFQLYPYDYLRVLPDIAEATEVFLSAPTESGATALLAQYKVAAAHYRQTVESQLASFEALFEKVPPNELGYYFFVDSGTSPEIVYHDLQLIKQNALQLEREIQAREDCLFGRVACERLRSRSNPLQLTADIFQAPDNLDAAKLAVIQHTVSYQDQIERVTGPFALESPCWYTGSDGIDWTYVYTYDNSANREIQKVRAILAEETYYSYVPEDSAYEIQQHLHNLGVKYQNQIAAFPYQCTDLTFYPQLLTADFIATAAEAENTTPSELLAHEYRLLGQNMFGVLAPAFDVVTNTLDLLRDNQRLNTDSIISPQFLLITRSAYAIVYMPYAQSVWRLTEQPTYMLPRDENLIERLRQDHIRLSELLKAGYTEDEIKKFHFTQWDYMTELLEQKAASE